MAIAFVQKTSSESTNSSSARTLAYPSNVAANGLLVVVVATYNNATATVTVTDSQGNTYSQADAYRTTSTTRISLWYAVAGSSGANTVTVTPSASIYMTLGIHEYSGGDTSAPLRSATGQTGGSDNNPLTGTVTASSGDMVFGCYAQPTIVSHSTVASPFTLRMDQIGLTAIGAASADDVAATGSEGASFTISSGNATWAAIGASFKPSGGGGGGGPWPWFFDQAHSGGFWDGGL